MHGHERHRHLGLAVAASLGLLAVGVSTGQAHTHPTATERAAPAVVFIEAKAHVEVTVIEHDLFSDAHGVHVHVFQDTSEPVLDTASGFFVDPNGTIVTTGALLQQDLDRGEVWAINQAFAKHYPTRAPLPADPFIRQHIGPSTDRIEQRLQACYPPHLSLQDAGGCVTRKQLDFVVYPFVTSQATDGNLPAEALVGKSTSDVGLLRVQTNGVPTVRLAPALPTDYALDVLGFVGTPGPVSSVPDPKNLNPHGEHDIVQHFAPIGGPIFKSVALKPDEAAGSAMLKQQLGKGIEGGPVVDGGKDAASGGQVIGLIPAPAPPGQPVPTLVGATTILNVLKNAGVTNQSSLASAQFEAAMHHFKNQEYAASIPYFVNSLKQFRGQALATADLAKARDQVSKNPATATPGPSGSGGPGGSGGSGGSSRTTLLAIGLVAAALVALVILGLALRARRREVGKDVTTPPSGGSTATRVPVGGGPRHGSQPSPGGVPGAARVPVTHLPRDGAPAAPSTRSAAPRTAERPGLPHQGSSTPPPPPNQPSRRRPSPAQPSTSQPSTIDRSTDNNPAPAPPLMAEAQSAATAPSSHWTAFCTSCGARLSERHRFCGLCGAPVGQ